MAQVNRIPMMTWGQNLYNYGEADPSRFHASANASMKTKNNGILTSISDAIIKEYTSAFARVEYGTGADFVKQNEEHYNCGYFVHGIKKSNKPLFFHFEAGEQDAVIYHNIIVAEPHSQVHVIMDYQYGNAQNGITKIWAKPHSKVTVLKIHAQSDADLAMDACGILVEEKADVELISIELGAENAFTNYSMVLKGDQATGNMQGLFLGGQDEKLDLNYRIILQGKESNGIININGILLDNAQKKFRGTLDFQRGCAGSVGDESETTTLLSDAIRNISIPLMLCQEDDVAGNHAATVGRLDEEALFYLICRGISEEEARTMLLMGKCTTILDKIPEKELREKIYTIVSQKINEES